MILLIGGGGQLGTALRSCLTEPVVAPSHGEFDIVVDDIGPLLDEHAPRAVVNCAAFHNVDRCEREPQAAFAANAIAVNALAAACAARGTTFVTVSTDYVFAGDAGRPYAEDDVAQPRTAYGTSKLAGELLSRRHGARTIIVRTSGVFGTTGTSSKGYTLIDKVLGQAERGEPTTMVADMTFSPSYAPHVARAIVALIGADAFGTHHVTNGGACTWFEFVRTVFARAGFANAPLSATTYAAFGNPTPRPMFSPLVNTTFARLGIPALPSWEAAVDEYLAVRESRGALSGAPRSG